MKGSNIIFLSLILLAVSSCSREKMGGDSTSRKVSVNAEIQDKEQKTTVLNGGVKVYWEPSEHIKLFCGDASGELISTNTENQATTKFHGEMDKEYSLSANTPFYALYPYSEDASCENGIFTVNLSSEQIGRAGSFASNTCMCIACSADDNLTFHNVCGGVRFTLSRDDIKTVTVEGRSSEILAGKVKIGLDGDVPYVGEKIAGKMKVSLSAPGGGVFKPGEWYYITMFPVSFSTGIKFTFHTLDGETGTLESDNPILIKRSTFASKTEIDAGIKYWHKTGNVVPDLSVCTVKVEIPENSDPEYVSSFVLSNLYGDYPIMSSGSSSGTKAGPYGNLEHYFNYQYVSDGSMLQLMKNRNDETMLMCIAKPGEDVTVSPLTTALAIIMTHQLLITSDSAQRAATKLAIMDLDSFMPFVTQVRARYEEAVKNNACPYYGNLDISPIINELLQKGLENASFPKNGLYISNIQNDDGEISFHLRNDYKRVIHVYARRAKTYDNGIIVKHHENVSFTLREFFKHCLDLSFVPSNYLLKERFDNISESADWVIDVYNDLTNSNVNLDMAIPYFCESGSAKYWSIVGAAAENLYRNGQYWDPNLPSIYESNHDLSFNIEDYDKLYVDIYGAGIPDKEQQYYSEEDLLRTLAVFVHGGYKDVVEPIIKLVTGVEKMDDRWNLTDYDNDYVEYRYDLRYGARKWPEWALVCKLVNNLEPKHITKFFKKLDDGDPEDFVSAFKYLGKYAYEQIVENKDNEDRRTYWNLIYNIFKKYTGINSTPDLFRAAIKKVWDGIGIAHTTVKISEAAMNSAGGIYDLAVSDVKTTFIINESQTPFINVISPLGRESAYKDVIVFDWDVHRGNKVGVITFDLSIRINDGHSEFFKEYKGLSDSELSLNAGELPDLSKAINADFRIVARTPVEVIADTGFIDMFEEYKILEDVPGYKL